MARQEIIVKLDPGQVEALKDWALHTFGRPTLKMTAPRPMTDKEVERLKAHFAAQAPQVQGAAQVELGKLRTTLAEFATWLEGVPEVPILDIAARVRNIQHGEPWR